MNLSRLEAGIEQAWSRETSADPDNWSEQNPAWGQCAVTALLVQDNLGGSLLRGMVGDISHYFNHLPSGDRLDLTVRQFPHGTDVTEVAERDRDYVLSFEPTRQRYQLLKSRLSELLNS